MVSTNNQNATSKDRKILYMLKSIDVSPKYSYYNHSRYLKPKLSTCNRGLSFFDYVYNKLNKRGWN